MFARRPSLGRRCGPIGIVGLACLLIVSQSLLHAASATQPAKPDRNIAEWISSLDQPSPTLRAAATSELMRLTRDDLPALKLIVQKSLPLSPSQSQVLHDVVTHVYLTGEKYEPSDFGFVGMRMAPVSLTENDGDPSQGIIVQSRMPGFAAYRSLLDGDVILGITENQNEPIDTVRVFTTTIQATTPGETLHFVLLRQGRQMIVPVKVDARPKDLDPNKPDFDGRRIVQFNTDRMLAAEEYWRKEFGGIVGEAYSLAD